MEKKELLLKRLEQIGEAVKNTKDALALLALGSCGVNRERLDAYSDLDFFVIAKDGCKDRFTCQLDWLEEVAAVGFYFKNTQDGYKLLFEDGVYCEFAVFEAKELQAILVDKSRFVWKEDDFEEDMGRNSIQSEPVKQIIDTDWVIGEALTNLYVGLERYARGEKLSAYKFVQSYAVDRMVELISVLEEGKAAERDIFDNSRRFESRYPDLSKELSGFIQGYDRTPEAAIAILEFIDKHFRVNECMKKSIMELI